MHAMLIVVLILSTVQCVYMGGGDDLPTFIPYPLLLLITFPINKFSYVSIIIIDIIAKKFVREKFFQVQPATIVLQK